MTGGKFVLIKKRRYFIVCLLVWVGCINFACSSILYAKQVASPPQLGKVVKPVAPLPDLNTRSSLCFADTQSGIMDYYNWLDGIPYLQNNLVFPLFCPKLPKSLVCLQNQQLNIRRQIFIKTLLPLIIKSNLAILHQRKTLLALAKAWQVKGQLNHRELQTLTHLAQIYLVNLNESCEQQIIALKNRVQVIPTSLVLAMAICETGWGRSRFLQEGNSLFSQVGYAGVHRKIMVPYKKHSLKFGVRCYPNLYASVQSFMLNLNTHRVYAQFRQFRQQGKTVFQLTDTLGQYAEAQGYSQKLRRIITCNGLFKYDKVRGFQDGKAYYVTFYSS